MQPRSILRVCGLCAIALIATAALAQSQPGNMMKMTVTTRMQIPGSPYGNMPARTHTRNVCTSAKKPDPREMVKRQKDCAISNYKQAGDTISYHMTCTGEMKMSGDATFRMQSGGDVDGSIHIVGHADGQAMTMDMSYDGKRTGSCDYKPPRADR